MEEKFSVAFRQYTRNLGVKRQEFQAYLDTQRLRVATR